MWFEIVPSFAIITVALAVPGVIKYFGHQLIFGNVRNWNLGNFKLVQMQYVLFISSNCVLFINS